MSTQTLERQNIEYASSGDYLRFLEAQFAAEEETRTAIELAEDVDSPEKYREVPDVLLAADVLDPEGILMNRAVALVAEHRANHTSNRSGPEPMTDMLGGARMVHAFRESRTANEIHEAEQNWLQDIRTMLSEIIQKGGHISHTMAEINALGEATVGPIAHYELFLRAAHLGPQKVRAHEIMEEFLSATQFHDDYLRENFALLVTSPARKDTPGNTLMARYIEFVQDPQLKWRRETQQLYMANSNSNDAKHALQELTGLEGTADPLEILGTVLLIKKEKIAGIADFAQIIDTISKDRTGKEVFCGIPVGRAPEREQYTDLLKTSLLREQNLEVHARALAKEALELAGSDTSFETQRRTFVEMVITQVRQICKEHPEYAEAAFGKYAAQKYKLAKELRENGDTTGADAAENAAYEASTKVDFCETELSVGQLAALGSSEAGAEMHDVLPWASLEEKYGFLNVFVADCLSCRAERVKVGPCQFCNVCDTKDRLKPGYIKALMESKKVKSQTTSEVVNETVEDSSDKKYSLRSGNAYRLGKETVIYAPEVVVGGTEAVFVNSFGQKITGDAAKELANSLVS